MPNAEPLLQVSDLRVHFPLQAGLLGRNAGTVKAVDGVAFHIDRGEIMVSGNNRGLDFKNALDDLFHLDDGIVEDWCWIEFESRTHRGQRCEDILKHDDGVYA